MIQCGAVKLLEQEQEILRRSRRLSLGEDEMAPYRTMRIRVSLSKPSVGYREFFASMCKDRGGSAAESVEATMENLRAICMVPKGKRFNARGKSSCSGPDDVFDEALFQHLKDIAFAAVSDGCAAAVKSIQDMLHHLPKLRYQFRDSPHTTRTVIRHTLKRSCEGYELMLFFISGKNSFAKRARYSHRFKVIWQQVQKDSVDGDDLLCVLKKTDRTQKLASTVVRDLLWCCLARWAASSGLLES